MSTGIHPSAHLLWYDVANGLLYMEHLSVVPCYDKLAALLQAMSAPVQLSLMGCPRYEVVVLLYTMHSVYGTRSVTEGPSASAPAAAAWCSTTAAALSLQEDVEYYSSSTVPQ